MNQDKKGGAAAFFCRFTLPPSSFILPSDMFATPKKPSRIGAWDGRRHSSRSELPVLPRLLERPVLLRLGAVLLTALTVTVLAYHCGPTESNRVGQAVPHDLRARVYFEVPDLIQTERLRD